MSMTAPKSDFVTAPQSMDCIVLLNFLNKPLFGVLATSYKFGPFNFSHNVTCRLRRSQPWSLRCVI